MVAVTRLLCVELRVGGTGLCLRRNENKLPWPELEVAFVEDCESSLFLAGRTFGDGVTWVVVAAIPRSTGTERIATGAGGVWTATMVGTEGGGATGAEMCCAKAKRVADATTVEPTSRAEKRMAHLPALISTISLDVDLARKVAPNPTSSA